MCRSNQHVHVSTQVHHIPFHLFWTLKGLHLGACVKKGHFFYSRAGQQSCSNLVHEGHSRLYMYIEAPTCKEQNVS